MNLLVQQEIFQQDKYKINNFLKEKIKEENISSQNALDTIEDLFEFYKIYYLRQKKNKK